ncbi:CheR family methyltransferase [Roseomonas sp. CCTCC AB2023176]|uniref:CheR family methyltransferase n=1 Tax=Roseomonas sp. CCTCC AB2023176 TaxID=3342640 RepID=UPI0035D608CA
MSDNAGEAREASASGPVVIAVSGSAASTASLEFLLTRLPRGGAEALVLALQHREALDEARFRAVLAAAGRELTAIADGLPVEGGRTYLPDAGALVTVEEGRFRTRPAEGRPGERGTVDSLLVSLASDEEGRIVVVTLAGTNGDGTLGVKAVKEAGGLALAEETEESRAGDLAGSHAPAALADAVLPMAKLVERLAATLERLADDTDSPPDQPGPQEVAGVLAAIVTVLRNKTGHDFHGYKTGTFLRRVQRRMGVVGAERIGDYVEVLRERPDEAQYLFNDLLIGVTHFFRDPREFELLERLVIPKLFAGKGRADGVRAWVVGCSTGEEAYSLAILMREHMAALDEVPTVQIFASDLDGRALASARVGRYPADIAGAMTPERLARWFVREGTTYVVAKELREMCVFSQHSIVKDAPFSRLDLVSCRNLLIYLEPALQERVIPLFHFALKPGGVLFLGSSENASRHATLFAPIEGRSRIFRRIETGTRVLANFPFTAVERRPVAQAAASPRPPGATLARRAERFAERFAPAYVIVDDAHDVLHFSGRTGRYLEPAGGAASLNLLQLAHPDLRTDIRTALARAAEDGTTVQLPGLRMGQNGHSAVVDLVVEPVREAGTPGTSFVVLFKDGAAVPSSDAGWMAPGEGDYVRRIEADLRATRERLQATIEELESTNEELKSSNEEYQSLNEELQSANEELETSKEELQSVNEELTTVNGELAHRVQELTRATSDLRNFLASTQIATVFLDNDLRVTNFTPAVSEVLHVLESDIGRPIGHIKTRVAYDDLVEDARRVLRTLTPVEREVGNPATGARYILRVLPYRGVDNFIAGVVVNFVDITERQRAEEARRSSEERFRVIVESARDYAILTTDREGRIEEWLPGAAAVFGWTPDEVVGRDVAVLYTPEDRANRVPEEELATAWERGVASDVRWHLRKDGSRVFIEGSSRSLRDAGGRVRGVIKIGQDVTERREREEALRASEGHAKLLLAELQHRVRNTLAVIRSIARRTAETSGSVEEYASHLDGRIEAFARVQAAVTRDPSSGVDLEHLVAAELLAHAAREGEQVKRIGGPEVRLQPKAAETMALALHELAVNAVKHGALGAPGGQVEVTWRAEEAAEGGQRLLFEWVETGAQIPEGEPSRRGFGTELLERVLAFELNAQATSRFERDGLRCTILLPLTERVVRVEQKRPAGT